MSGVCAAISSARNGAKTALVQNRPVLGGNASSEIRVSINGAGRHEGFRNAMESGIILELLLRNKRVESAVFIQCNGFSNMGNGIRRKEY